MAKLLLVPGSFVADYCLPLGIESGPAPILCLIQCGNLATLGIYLGMVIVARHLLPDETPTEGSFCIVRINKVRYLKRVSFADDGKLLLSDDTAGKEFGQDEVSFEGIALHACSCNLRGSVCVPVPLDVETGLAAFRQSVGMMRWQTDEHGYLLVSEEMRGWISLLGGDPDAWAGWGWIDFLHPEDKDPYLFRWSEAIETGKPYLNQGRINIAGMWLYMVVSANPVRDASGRIVKWEGFLHLEAIETGMAA